MLRQFFIKWLTEDAECQVRRKLLRLQILASILFTVGLILLLTAVIQDYALWTWRVALCMGVYFANDLGLIRKLSAERP